MAVETVTLALNKDMSPAPASKKGLHSKGQIETMLGRYEKLRSVSKRRDLAAEICAAIDAYARPEERGFYLAVLDALKLDKVMSVDPLDNFDTTEDVEALGSELDPYFAEAASVQDDAEEMNGYGYIHH